MVLLVIDDNPADIHLLTLAWTEAGYDAEIRLHACHSCAAALEWLDQGKPRTEAPRGALVDLMLFDADGAMTIEVMRKHPHLTGLPIITWSGIDIGRNSTDRITKGGVRMWKKPPNWQGYAAFVRRLMNHIIGQSSASSSRLPITM